MCFEDGTRNKLYKVERRKHGGKLEKDWNSNENSWTLGRDENSGKYRVLTLFRLFRKTDLKILMSIERYKGNFTKTRVS